MKHLLVDPRVCTGCRLCEAICSFHHMNGETNPGKSRIRIRQDLFLGRSEPLVCRQCGKPPCVSSCSKSAITRNSDLGIVKIDYEKCDLCLECKSACPFDAIHVDPQASILLVCDLCGGEPMCVRFCRPYPHNHHAALAYGVHRISSKLTDERDQQGRLVRESY
jgi:Fe-S-cluster-containing hydrogenase component 2